MKALKRPAASKLVLAALIAGVTLGACDGSASSNDQSYIERATQYRADGNLAAAIIELKNAVQMNPENAEARQLLGEAHLAAGDVAGAEKELLRARELGSTGDGTLVPLMRARLAAGKYDEVLGQLEEPDAVTDQVERNVLRGQALLGLGQSAKARGAFEASLQQRPDERAFAGLAWLALAEGKIDEAEDFAGDGLAAVPDSVDLVLVQAEIQLRRDDYAAAERSFRQVVERRPENFGAQVGLARALIGIGNIEDSASLLDGLLKRAPNDPRLNYFRAAAAFEMKNYELALQHVGTVLNAAENNAAALYLAGAAAYSLERFELANSHLSHLLTVDPSNIEARKSLAAAQLRLGKADEAAGILAAGSVDGADAELLAMAGGLALRAGDRETGLRYIGEAVARAPDDTLRAKLGLMRISAGEAEQGIVDLSEAIEGDPKLSRLNPTLILAQIQSGQFEDALRNAQALQAAQPDLAAGFVLEALVYRHTGKLPQAIDSLKRGQSARPNDVSIELGLAELYAASGDLDSAQKAINNVRQKQPNDARSYLMLALIAGQQNRPAEQERLLKQAVDIDPDAVGPRILLARGYLQARQAEQAIDVIAPALDAQPENPAALEIAGRAHLAAGNHDQAVAAFNALSKLTPTPAVPLYMAAQAHAAKGDTEATQAALEDALRADPGYSEARYALARLFLRKGEPERAAAEAEKLEAAWGASDPNLLKLKGGVLTRQGKVEDAVAVYRQVMDIEPDAETAIELSRLHQLREEDAEAARLLAGWLEEHPDDHAVRFELANLEIGREGFEEAGRHFAILAEALPGQSPILNNYAWALYRSGDLDEALRQAERALELTPDNPAIKDTLGVILIDVGQPARAVELLDDAYRALSDQRTVGYHFARALTESGDDDRAREVLGELLSDDQDFQERQEAETLLRSLES